MATIRKFEDIEAWKRARELTRVIYACTAVGQFSRDFALRAQIRRASVSVMSNIAEGFERDGSREFLQFLSVAKGSVGELESQLYVARDQQYLRPETFKEIMRVARSTKSLIAGFMCYLRTSALRGRKYRPQGAKRVREDRTRDPGTQDPRTK